MVVDDKPLAVDILAAYIAKLPWLDLVYSSGNPLEALDYLRAQPADLIFLDIQMPELNGLQFIRVSGGKIPVILTTAYADYALDGYAYDVVDYLLKPIPFDRFCQAAEKARLRIEGSPSLGFLPLTSPCLFVKTEHKIQRVALDDILFIEAKQNYISLETLSGKIMSLQGITSIEEKLPRQGFLRVHKSFIVALDKIDTIERSRIFIKETVIPIGDSYREALFRALKP
jgi:two-component system, LytTR family, response regulator